MLLFLGLGCGLFGIAAWVFYGWAFGRDPGQDWMVFYTAARSFVDGNLPLIFDGERLTAALNQRFAGWMGFTLNLHPWVYPPTFLLLFLPFGLLPPVASFAAFQAAGFLAALGAGWRYAGRCSSRAMVLFSLVLCPAVPFTVMTGQNAFFSVALLIGGFGLLGRSPVLAGALLGILTFKPQLWLMVPVALIAARQWRALASSAVTALVLTLLSLAVFGTEIWHQWILLMAGADAQYHAWVDAGRINGLSVFACIRLLGGSDLLANAGQVVAIAVAAGCVYGTFRQRNAGPLAVAALLAATILAAPHTSASDALLLGLAASVFLAAIPADRLRPGYIALAVGLWCSPLLNPPSVFRAGLVTPLLLVAFLACIMTLLREKTEPAAMRAFTLA